MGTILRVDLTNGTVTKEPLDTSVAEQFLGGRGLNSYTLFKELTPGIDPLSPENILCLAPGALTATGMPLSSRIEVSTLSPLSNILGDGSAGGHFPTFFKRAGYDQVVITGKAEKPTYLWIEDDHVELRDAEALWGTTIWETADTLIAKHGKGTRVAGIGQAGEHLVRFASTIFDKHASAARGTGAVWGSKNLKAIAVRGTKKPEIADPEAFKELIKTDRDFFKNDKFQRETVAVYGTHIGMMYWGPGVRNFENYIFGDDVPEQLRPEAWKKYETGRYFCYACPVGCKNTYKIPEGDYAGEENSALEFEAIYCLGTNSGIEDPIAIMEMENLADKYGMCVVPLGNAIALAKDLYNRGIISKEETGGLELDWENEEAQVELVHRIALREGFGDLVAEGMYSFAKLMNKNALDYCYHVKGLSRGTHPAGIFSLAHATGTRGADHLRGRTWAYGENDPELLKTLIKKGLMPDVKRDIVGTLTICERVTTIADSIGRCKGAVTSWVATVPLIWQYPILDGVGKLLKAATGIEYSGADVERTAERIFATERSFNVRQGISRKHDRIPLKAEILGTPREQEELTEHERVLTEYYNYHGYDPDSGIPTRERLESLGLRFIADELEANAPYPDWDGPPLWPLEKYPHGGSRG